MPRMFAEFGPKSNPVSGRWSVCGAGVLGGFLLRVALVAAVLVHNEAAPAHGQDLPREDGGQGVTETGSASLADSQREIAEKYDRLEQILLRMSELSAGTDPRRAALLKKAVAESRQRMIGVQFDSLVELLSRDQLSPAINAQESIDGDLNDLLELLLSENRSKRIQSEKARIREYLKTLNQIINRQKGLQARTTGGTGRPGELAQEQGRIGEQTGGLAEEIRRNEEGEPEGGRPKDEGAEPEVDPSEGEGRPDTKPAPSDGGNPDEPPDPAQPGPEQEAESEKGDGSEGKPSAKEKSPSTPEGNESGESRGEPSDQQDGPSGSQGGSPSQSPAPGQPDEGHPARQRLEEAKRRMEEARKNLEDAKREGAAEQQEEAIRQLQQAKAELEEILRQLREEEIEQMLVALEARLMQMLQMQREVYEGTDRLDRASADGLTHEQEIESGRLSSREVEIISEADKALMLLWEDGTAVAFPEALSQARDDMRQVAERLAGAKLGELTLSLEEDIIAALDEMLEAVRQAIEDAEQRRSNSGPGQPGTPQDPALVDLLSEIRMIRALQMRVNTQTDRYSKMIAGAHAQSTELIEALRRLAERQDRIHQITRDLETGRNR